MSTPRPRLVLVTPRPAPAEAFAETLALALSGGDVAAVIVDLDGLGDEAAQRLAEALVPVAQAAGAAAMVAGDTRIAGRARADGVHVDVGALLGPARPAAASGEDEDGEDEDDDGPDPAAGALAQLVARHHPNRAVGAGGLRGRHDAMLAAEADVDYVMTGRLDLVEGEEPNRKTVDFADWWVPLFEIPCIALGGRSIAALAPLVEIGVEFVALRAAVWEHPDGPAAAVRAANLMLDAPAAEPDAGPDA